MDYSEDEVMVFGISQMSAHYKELNTRNQMRVDMLHDKGAAKPDDQSLIATQHLSLQQIIFA